MKTLKSVSKKLCCSAMTFATTFAVSFQSVFADGNEYAQKGGEWILDGIYWVILCATVFSVGMAAVKRNLSGALISVLVGGLVLVIIKNPTILETLGNAIKGIIGL